MTDRLEQWPPEVREQLADALTEIADELLEQGEPSGRVDAIVQGLLRMMQEQAPEDPVSEQELNALLRSWLDQRALAQDVTPPGTRRGALPALCVGIGGVCAVVSTFLNQGEETPGGNALGVAFLLFEVAAIVLGIFDWKTAMARASAILALCLLVLVFGLLFLASLS